MSKLLDFNQLPSVTEIIACSALCTIRFES
jgi:hypothetical protein